MHSFVYGSRVIENEQQITLERRVQKLGNYVGTFVKAFVAFFLFFGLNALLSNLVQHTHLFSFNLYVETYRFLQEAVRVLFVDNAFTTTSFLYQFTLSLVSAIICTSVVEYELVVRTFAAATEHSDEENYKHDHTECVSTVEVYNVVSYKQKVCFLS